MKEKYTKAELSIELIDICDIIVTNIDNNAEPIKLPFISSD